MFKFIANVIAGFSRKMARMEWESVMRDSENEK